MKHSALKNLRLVLPALAALCGFACSAKEAGAPGGKPRREARKRRGGFWRVPPAGI